MDLDEARQREDAYRKGKSVLARDTAAVTRQRPGLGIVPIRTAGDFFIRALAFGRLDDEPTKHFFPEPHRPPPWGFGLVTSQLLDLFAQDDWQIWIPDQDARLVLGLEAERHRGSLAMLPEFEVFARVCDALFHQSQSLEQQVVVVATEILGAHLIPGQSATEDGHLGVRLAWDKPEPFAHPRKVAAHPRKVAQKRRKQRGPTWLPFADDEKIETIRARVLRGAAFSEDLRQEVEILDNAVSASWEMLQKAHQAYQELPVRDLPGLEVVANQSWQDFMSRVAASPSAGAPAASTPEAD
jgi:hypothetical protein